MRLCILFAIACLGLAAQSGDYLGMIEIPSAGVKLRMALHLVKQEDGSWKGAVDSLDQGARGLPVQVTIEGRAIRFGSGFGMTYEGQFNEAGDAIEGAAMQRGQRMTLNFRKVDKIEPPRRPQTPQRPFPYREEEVVVPSGSIKLGGTLSMPPGDGPFPAVIFLTGSGAQDRDETMFDHRPFLVISDLLVRNGIATLRLDDRGVGKSAGMLAYSTIQDLAGDAAAAFEFLKTRKEIQASKIGYLGHSEGGITGPLAATRTGAAFVILLAASGVPGDEILMEQGQAALRAAGGSAELRAFQARFLGTFLPLVKSVTDNTVLAQKIREAWEKWKAEDPQAAAADAQVAPQLQQFLLPALQGFVRHDPRPVLAALNCPVLAINGGLDTQVSLQQNLPAIAAALSKAANPDFTVAGIPQLNHLFQTAKTGAIPEYMQIEETISPRVLDLILHWLKARI